jgi:hypothetical protein
MTIQDLKAALREVDCSLRRSPCKKLWFIRQQGVRVGVAVVQGSELVVDVFLPYDRHKTWHLGKWLKGLNLKIVGYRGHGGVILDAGDEVVGYVLFFVPSIIKRPYKPQGVVAWRYWFELPYEG